MSIDRSKVLAAAQKHLQRGNYDRALEEYQRLVRADPNDGEALMAAGMANLGLGRYALSIAAFQRQEELGVQPERAAYNMACAYALSGDPDSAIACLERSAAGGWDVRAFAARDPDLASVRDDPRLEALGPAPAAP